MNAELFASNLWVIQQKKHWGEILVGWETTNKYAIYTQDGKEIGYIAEEGSGIFQFLKRLILRGHRPFKVVVFDAAKNVVFHIRRPWFWFFSSTYIEDAQNQAIGAIHRRFRIFSRRYDIHNGSGQIVGHVHAGLFRIWKFDLLDPAEKLMGLITKKWGGLLKEVFTDADRFVVQLENGAPQDPAAKAAILGAAVALDFDHFEDNQTRPGIFSGN